MRKNILITGSSGLIGGEVVEFLASKGNNIYGIDNNMREEFFGPQGSTSPNLQRLKSNVKDFTQYNIDIRDRKSILELIKNLKPDAIVHTAAQPSHDRAAKIPFLDFEVNAVGTLNLLEATRQYCPESPFVHLSTNKVYGDSPNKLELTEMATRWEFKGKYFKKGIDESLSIDSSTHSIFGLSKASADLLVREYGRYFNIPTCVLRGGCLTGQSHSGVELHGFLNYLIRCNLKGKEYTIYGYKGKQVRDNIHSYDVASFISKFINEPKVAAIYNIGGGYGNSISLMESISKIESISVIKMNYKYSDISRIGDHICYYSNLDKIKNDYPNWEITKNLDNIFIDVHDNLKKNL